LSELTLVPLGGQLDGFAGRLAFAAQDLDVGREQRGGALRLQRIGLAQKGRDAHIAGRGHYGGGQRDCGSQGKDQALHWVLQIVSRRHGLTGSSLQEHEPAQRGFRK
jgi:hypothetical protein